MKSVFLAIILISSSASASAVGYKMKLRSSTITPVQPGSAKQACKTVVDAAMTALNDKCASIQGSLSQTEVEINPNDGQYSTCDALVTTVCTTSLD